jgi:hypothetical protein
LAVRNRREEEIAIEPHTYNQQVLQESIAALEVKYPDFMPELNAFLRRGGSTIVYAKLWRNPRLAAVRVAPSPAIQQQFDISLEIPVLIAIFDGDPPLEPRALRHLDTSGDLRGSLSADKDIAVLVASDDSALDFVRDRRRFGFPILVLNTRDLAEGRYRDTDLRTEFGKLLRSVNHFDFSNEITSGKDFFGRVDEIEALCALAASGQSVGLFGLRRAGKTSLLLQVQLRLGERGIETSYVQLNGIIDADALRETLVRRVAERVLEAGKRLPTNSEMLNSDGSLKSTSLLARRWIYEIDGLLTILDRDLVFVLDESDLANEDADEFDESAWDDRRDMNRVLQQLRGLIQIRNERGGKNLSFISAGVAASIYASAVRFGRDNQLFGFASIRPLRPMSRDEMREMVRTLGKRSGMRFDRFELFDALFHEYGGHPYLTRMACSTIAEQRSRSSGDLEVPYHVTRADVEASISRVGEAGAAHAAWQTLQSFLRWYPEEEATIMQVVRGEVDVVDPSRASHAVDFGLLDPSGELRLTALRRYATAR